jgi:hypothetical protein
MYKLKIYVTSRSGQRFEFRQEMQEHWVWK